MKENFGEEKKDKNNKDITEPEPSVVSLREMNRFKSCVYFFQDYYLKKDSFLNIYDKNKINDE